MRFFHIADLHIGKTLNNYSLLEDQQYILSQILQLAQTHKPDAVVIAGDVYDRSVPSEQAVRLFDQFINELNALDITVAAIAGNHDSHTRLGAGSRIMQKAGVHICGDFNGLPAKITLEGKQGPVDFHLLPYISPLHARRYYPDAQINCYNDGLKTVMEHVQLQKDRPNVLVAHQFVISGTTSPEISDSELRSVGGLDEVDAGLFSGFNYVALGHLHKPQKMGSGNVYYSGSPLKYSFSERGHKKSLNMVDISADVAEINQLELTPLRDLRQITGTIEDILENSKQELPNSKQDYLKIILTNSLEVPDAAGKLRSVYPNLMEINYSNTRTQNSAYGEDEPKLEGKTPEQLFAEFYTLQNGEPPAQEQMEILRELLEQQHKPEEEGSV